VVLQAERDTVAQAHIPGIGSDGLYRSIDWLVSAPAAWYGSIRSSHAPDWYRSISFGIEARSDFFSATTGQKAKEGHEHITAAAAAIPPPPLIGSSFVSVILH
jgi:hypothetical protein